MTSFFCLFFILAALTLRSQASFQGAVGDENGVVSPTDPFSNSVEPQTLSPVAISPPAPAMASAPAMIIPHASVYSHALPDAMHSPYYYPRTAIHNVVRAFSKESGHASDTLHIYPSGHIPDVGHFFPARGFTGTLPLPVRSRLHRRKLVNKKRTRSHKLIHKKN